MLLGLLLIYILENLKVETKLINYSSELFFSNYKQTNLHSYRINEIPDSLIFLQRSLKMKHARFLKEKTAIWKRAYFTL